MSLPDDDGARYIVDLHPTVRVLDRAYTYRIVHQLTNTGGQTLKARHARAVVLAADLNATDTDTDEAA